MAPWQLHCLCQSFNCAILVACPRINHREVSDQRSAIDGIFAYWDQLDGAMAFADRVLVVSESSINDTDRTKSRCVIGLFAYDLLKVTSSAGKCGLSCLVVSVEPGDETAAPTVRKWDVLVVTAAWRHGCQRAVGCSRVALAEGEIKPMQNDEGRRVWVLVEGRLDCRM